MRSVRIGGCRRARTSDPGPSSTLAAVRCDDDLFCFAEPFNGLLRGISFGDHRRLFSIIGYHWGSAADSVVDIPSR